uniref:Uncharacterized protein n=1 Tax=Tanacetum cinerariifolium TaxID=118510 RepID=A0A699IJA9_TANCI|nr:hypothetical protein [Tanacetum cinerariifolium]
MFCVYYVQVKDKQETEKIGSKPDKNRKCGEAGKSQKQLQSREQEKLKKMQVEGPKLQTPTKLYYKERKKGAENAIISKYKEMGQNCQYSKAIKHKDQGEKASSEKDGSTADQLSTARPEVCTVTPSTPPTTTTIFGDEDLTIAQTLIKLRSEKAKEKGVAFRDSTKGKIKQEEAAIAALTEEFDEIQARIDVDHELVVRMTHEEQEKYTIEERARLLAEYFERRKKQLAAKRAKAIRNKPPTRTQVRNMMITCLKHMGMYTRQQLKHKIFKELQKLYQKEKKWIDDFVPMDSKKEEKKSVEPEKQESAKSDEKESVDYEHEKEELRMWLAVVLDEEETVDPKILSTKYPIGDWESQILGNVDIVDLHVNKIIRANRNINYHKSLFSMLRKFDRQDLVDLHILVMKRFKDNTLEEKRYPLIKEMLEKILKWKLEAEAESTMAFKLLKFNKSHVEE